jgi:membrane protein required for colicin V production
LASLLSLILGIYIAIKFSSVVKDFISGWLHWNPYTVQIFAFILTFIVVVIGIYMLGKILTNVADFAFLGWINSLGGGFFRVLKSVLIMSIFLTIFEKMNYHNYLAKKETLDKSIFFNPIQKVTGFIFPSIEKWYDTARK